MAKVNSQNLEGFQVLPEELLISIFRYLSPEMLVTCENVCRHWKKVANEPAVWRSMVVTYSGKRGESELYKNKLKIIHTHGSRIYNLKLNYIHSYQDIKTLMEKCGNLVSIDLVMCIIRKEFEDDIKKWPNLKSINLKNSLLFTDDDLIIPYDYFKKLNFLALSDLGLCSINCNTLLQCPNLNHILIDDVQNLELDFMKELITSKQNTLITLHIYGGDSIDDHCLQLISQCSQLTNLAINKSEKLTDKGLISLLNLKKIEHLKMWNNSNFSEVVLLQTLSGPYMQKLQTLSLPRIKNVSPAIVYFIYENYNKLKSLEL